MKYSFFRSIRTQLLILVLLSVLPALGIVIYSGLDRQYRDIEDAKGNALRVLQSFASDHERTVESTRQLLITLAQLPDVQNLNAPACNRLFLLLLKENPVFANISAATAKGMVFANALPFISHSVKEKKYFQDILRTRDFSVGEYVIEATLQKPVLHLAYPIIDARGTFKGAVAVAFGLDRYGQMFTRTKLPEDSVLGIYDHKHVRLLRSHEADKYVGKADGPKMVTHMSAPPEEGSFTAVGNDGVKRFMAYRRFYLKGSASPYLSMRVGIAEKQVLARARNTLFNNVALLCSVLIVVTGLAWFLGNIIIVRRLKKLADVARQLGRGDLTARTESDYHEDELGRLTKSFDEMAGKLEQKERERKQTEDALREKENLFRLLFEKSGDGNLLIDNGVFIDCNDAALRMLGCHDKGKLLDRKLSDISPERQPDGALSSERELILLTRALKEGHTRFEWQHKTFGGENLFVDVMLTAVPMKGRWIIFTAWRDITDKKIIEQELIHKEKLSSLGMLVSGISHEINNPNNFIVFNIPILREYIRELIPIIDEYAAIHQNYTIFGMTYDEFREDIFKLMDNLEHGADRINATVSNLQEFSRKKVRGARKEIRIQDILDKAVAICRSQINKSSKSFEIYTEEGLPKLVTDPEVLEQVLINLLINATQALYRKDSFIKVQLLKGTRPSDDIIIEVIDNGIGFDEQTKARLFEPFFTTKPTGMGTGIGLYIVKKIIDGLGGIIEVKSRPGEGSTFRVILSNPKVASGHAYYKATKDGYA